LYVGHTADLARRAEQHRERRGSEFAKAHYVERLVWYEFHDSLDDAQRRERLIKRWRRQWKLELIEEHNPDWRDLYHDLA
jgi:putative endonuclease